MTGEALIGVGCGGGRIEYSVLGWYEVVLVQASLLGLCVTWTRPIPIRRVTIVIGNICLGSR